MFRIFEVGGHMLALPGKSRRIGTGLLSRKEAGPTLYVATAMLSVSHSNDALK